MSQDPNQLGGGLAFPSALGVQFSYAQIRGNSAPVAPEMSTIVTLLQSGNIISALPGTSSVDIGETTVGLDTQYITQMAGTTMINSPTVINGNVVLPHQFNFSMNPEQNATLPTATINATLNVGSAALSNVNANFTTQTFNIFNGADVSISSAFVQVGASTISLFSDDIELDGRVLNIFETTQTTLTSPSFTVNSDTTIINGGAIGLTATSNAGISSEGSIYLNSQTQSLTAEQYIIIGTSNIQVDNWDTVLHTSNIYSNYAGTQFLVADGGINPAFEPTISIQSLGGYQGKVVMEAYPGGVGGIGLNGAVEINAFGSSNGLLTYGGLITINAYSGGIGEYGGFGSAIRMNSATINLSAGGEFALPAIPGSLNLFGQGAISLVSAVFPPILPQTPQSVYLYGNGGVTFDGGYLGIYNKTDAYFTSNIYPDNFSAGLNITSNTVNGTPVYISGLQALTMTAANGRMTNVSSINTVFSFDNQGNIGGISSINGVPYPYPSASSINVSAWSQFPQIYQLSTLSALGMSASSIAAGTISTPSIYFSSMNGQVPPAWNGSTATNNLTMDSYSLENVGLLTCGLAGFRDMTISTIAVSTINGIQFPQPIGPNVWVSTATSDLFMDTYSIYNVGFAGIALGGFRDTLMSTVTTSTISANTVATSDIQTTTINGNPYQNIQEVTTPYNSGLLITEPPNISISIGNRPYEYLIFDTGAQRLHVVTQPGQYNIQANPMTGSDLGLDLVIDAELSLKGQYIIQNANISGGNNMTIYTKVYFVGTYYAFAAFQLSPGQSYSFQVVSHPNSVGGAVGVITGYQNLGIINPYFSI